jgi:hypothetical protein
MELFYEFLIFIASIMFWTAVVNLALKVLNRYLSRPTEEEFLEIKQKIISMIHFVKEEKHGDITYWFDEQSDEFLAQGATKDEIIAQARVRFPTHVFIIDNQQHSISGPDWKITPIGELSKKYNV